MKYELSGKCDRRCTLNPGRLPAGVGELIHRWYEEGANRETIIARASELGVKLAGGSIGRHKSNHLIPANDPNSPLAGGDEEPGRKFTELEVLDAVIQRFARHLQKGTVNITAEQGLRAIETKQRLTEGSVFDELFAALSGDDEEEDLSDLGPPSE